MANFVRMELATGAVDASTQREGAPVLVDSAGAPTLECKGWRWLEIVPVADLSPWESEGVLPAMVSPNATTISREVVSVSLSDWKARRVAVLRQEAGSRITAFAPQHLQNNILARAVEITRKRATGTELTAQDEADETQCLSLWAQIDPIRDACNAAEAAVNATSDHTGVETAYAAVAWP